MRDDEFTKNVEQVEAILEELEQSEVPRDEGERLKQEALQILEDTKQLLSLSTGKVVVVKEKNDEIVEKPVDPSSKG